MKDIIFFCLGIISLGVVAGLLQPRRKRRRSAKPKHKVNKSFATNRRLSMECRSDEIILSSGLDDLSGAEFERLLALYFRDQGYTVKEVGVGGNDGGVDLVITDKRGEKTAVQAKCYADHNYVGVTIVRELVGAKRNHDCILSLLVTTSDLTTQAKKEAEQFKVEYWHGALLEQKLRNWSKWQPSKKKIQSAKREIAAASSVKCKCGASMIKRKGKDGQSFWGCSTFPKCRHTQAI